AVPAGTDYASLTAWGSAPQEPVAVWKRWVAEVLGWGNVSAWVGWLLFGTGPVPVAAFGLLSFAVVWPLGAWARRVLGPVEKAEADLSLLEAVLGRFERERYAAPKLVELQAALRAGGRSAAAQIRELRLMVGWLNARRNG